MTVRTDVIDTTLSQTTVRTDGEADAVAHCSISGTRAAVGNTAPLLDWDEYNDAMGAL